MFIRAFTSLWNPMCGQYGSYFDVGNKIHQPFIKSYRCNVDMCCRPASNFIGITCAIQYFSGWLMGWIPLRGIQSGIGYSGFVLSWPGSWPVQLKGVTVQPRAFIIKASIFSAPSMMLNARFKVVICVKSVGPRPLHLLISKSTGVVKG